MFGLFCFGFLTTDLRHKACPAAGSVVDGVQLLQQSGGVGQTVVFLHDTLHQFTVGTVQQFGVVLKLGGQLVGDKGSEIEHVSHDVQRYRLRRQY